MKRFQIKGVIVADSPAYLLKTRDNLTVVRREVVCSNYPLSYEYILLKCYQIKNKAK